MFMEPVKLISNFSINSVHKQTDGRTNKNGNEYMTCHQRDLFRHMSQTTLWPI